MIRKNIKWILPLIIVAMIASMIGPTKCTTGGGSSTYVPKDDVQTTSLPVLQLPDYNADSAYMFTQKQVDFGARVPGTPAHISCKKWIINKFTSFGAQVSEQKFDGVDGFKNKSTGYNIIARYNVAATKRIVLSSHWDSRRFSDQDAKDKKNPVLGADDGASGVGTLLEVARNIQQKNPNIGVDFVLFDLEDQGAAQTEEGWCLGSQYWAKNLHFPVNQAAFGILLDMSGARGARFTKEGISVKYAPMVVENVWKIARNLGYYNYFVNDNTPDLIDDHKYVNELAGIKMIDIINRPIDGNGFGEYWHTQHDNMEVIDRQTLKAVGTTLISVLHYEGQGVL